MISFKTNLQWIVLAGFMMIISSIILKPAFSQNTLKLQPLYNVNCDLPLKVEADSEFKTGFQIAKEVGYVGPMTIVQKLPRGFSLLTESLPYAEVSIDGQQFEVFWKNLPLGDTFSFELDFRVSDVSPAAYPLNGVAHFYGFSIDYGNAVLIQSNTKTVELNFPELKKEKIYTVRLEYATEVIHGSDFELSIFTQKGKNTGPGSVQLILPKGSETKMTKEENSSHNQLKNELTIVWEHMPASPVFETKILVNTQYISKAAYMITAKFLIGQDLVATTENHILISDEQQLTVLKTKEQEPQNVDQIDTTEMFSELDKLLVEWQQTTGGNQKVELKQNTITAEDYRIQIFASKTALPNIRKLLLSMNINETYNEHYDGEYYRYTVGMFKNRDECVEYLEYLQAKGFSDAFMKKYLDGEPAKGE